jgi:hypothetical protein
MESVFIVALTMAATLIAVYDLLLLTFAVH